MKTVKQKRNCDVSGSSDDDIPLSSHKSNKKTNIKQKTESNKTSEIINKNNFKRVKKPSIGKSQYINGKRIFCRSGSESTDFEKYTYYDENKTKRKIKIPPDLSVDDLEKQIAEIKTENVCLMEEHKRINQLKLKERLKLRSEIRRLKSCIAELKITSISKNTTFPDIGNTSNYIKALKEFLKNVDLCKIELNEKFMDKLKSLEFTDSNFWQEFNSIEVKSKEIYPTALWTGKLDKIDPNNDVYYKPNADIFEYLKISEKNENILANVQNNKNSINIENCDRQSNINSSSDESTDSFQCNGDWNQLATKKKAKREIQTPNLDDQKILPQVEDSFNDFSSNDSNIDAKDFPFDVKDENQKFEPNYDIENDIFTKDDNLCTECGFDSNWSSFIARHREAYQNNIKLTPCHNCNMRYLNSGHFDGRHRLKRSLPKTVRPQIHICDICGQGCTTRSGLSQHRTRHADAKYSCPHCSYKCRRQAYLKKHIESHVKRANVDTNHVLGKLDCQESNAENGNDKSADGSMYHCEYCTYETSDKHCYDSHLKYHDKDKSTKDYAYNYKENRTYDADCDFTQM